MGKNKNIQSERFHYSPLMEITEWAFFGEGRRPSGMASAFQNYTYVKKSYRSLIKRIKKRIDEIVTNDEPLKQTLYTDLKFLDDETKKISPKINNDLEIIAHLFRLISHLLGWDYFDGKYHRMVIYHQTKDQQIESLRKFAGLRFPEGLFEAYYKRKIIKDLYSEGLSYSKIALILGLTETNVKQLEQAEHIDEMYNKEKKRMIIGSY